VLALPSQPDFQRADDFSASSSGWADYPSANHASSPFFQPRCFCHRLLLLPCGPSNVGGRCRRGSLSPQVFFEVFGAFLARTIRILLKSRRIEACPG